MNELTAMAADRPPCGELVLKNGDGQPRGHVPGVEAQCSECCAHCRWSRIFNPCIIVGFPGVFRVLLNSNALLRTR